MKKIISAFLLFSLIFLFGSCSRDMKIGIGEFSDRIYNDYKLTVDQNSFSLENENGKNKVYCKISSSLFVFYLTDNGNICGIAALLPKNRENDLKLFLSDFKKCSSVFTLYTLEETEKIFSDCGISEDKIKFTDGNKLYTVGKFKYSVVTNELSVTLFCERV